MNIPLNSVLDAGIAIRTLRKRASIRIDDFALTAGVSKQFMTDLENGKATVQMGMVLGMLQRMGVKVSLELPDTVVPAFRSEQDKAKLRKASRLKKSSHSLIDEATREGSSSASKNPTLASPSNEKEVGDDA